MKPLLPIANILGFIFTLVLNYLATTLPLNGKNPKELSDLYPNFFVPDPSTFAIWGVIYVGLLGFIIYQALGMFKKDEPMPDGADRIAWFFVVSCLANGAWIVAWHFQKVALSVIIMSLLLSTLIQIYLRLGIGRRSVTPAERWLVHAPFSLYLGWISIATIANITAALVDAGWTGFGIEPTVWASIMIGVGTLLTLIVLQTRKDIIFAAVVIWAFYGIIKNRYLVDPVPVQSIITTAYIGMALIAVFGLFSWLRPKFSSSANS